MPNETVPTVLAAMQAARQLADLRQALGQATAEVLAAERAHAYARANAEQSIIVTLAGGDEKKLGANEDARRRAFTLALEQDPTYVDARTALSEAEADRRIFEVDVRCAQDQLAILLAALTANITDLPAGILDPCDPDESSGVTAITVPAALLQQFAYRTVQIAAAGGAA